MFPLLSIQNLGIGFRQEKKLTPALHNISFSVNRGETVAIVGESGSGKSVTSLAILQLLPVPPAEYTSGSILFSAQGEAGVDLLRLSEKEMQAVRGNQISMIFQEPMTSLNPLYTCGNQVMEAIMLHQAVSAAAAKQKTVELFEKVQLPEPAAMFSRFPHEISGGQKQRVMIAMAMSCEPLLLIADEPTTALDVTVQQNILRLIKALQAEKDIGVIFISHDLGLVAEIADRIIVMFRGEIVEQNTTQALFTNPRHPYTRALLECRPVLHAKEERLPVVGDFMEMNEDGSIIRKERQPGVAKSKAGNGLHKEQNSNAEIKAVPGKTEQEGTAYVHPLVEVQNLKVWFPSERKRRGTPRRYIKAVDDVSFNIYKGEMVGLVGESGCGKTTLGRSLLRLIDPTGGAVYFKKQNLLHLSPAQLRHMRKDFQIIFQDPYSSLNPRLTVGSAIQEAMYIHGLGGSNKGRRDWIINILEKVNLNADHYNRYPHEFSGGQRQRIGIARALALRPSFIVCDESVSALDVSVQAQVLNLLNDVKEAFGFAALFISHDLSVVRYISDRILVMYQGKIEETGVAEEVYNAPQSAYTKRLIAAIPRGIPPPGLL
ncbi:ABC transporter ATP-binding protein [Agriterribacter sp.]|uniref:ABC transporter ATP-binding protein n=1 Tax=Agriterribacter sp. TaxID=2821509 RepID=UPI002C6309F0|nr:ABC transporter ATP-binding protein [Agriterribacter sp.]HRO47743.1 ABC transporter ATP-binding protein [Agriterribacter sp.]HRQ17194.1 ABC transporter ATP-binding protein [Agriterribacter sp.]